MLERAGWWKDRTRHGDHFIYRHDDRPAGTPSIVQVPRHNEIKELTAKNILKDAGLR